MTALPLAARTASAQCRPAIWAALDVSAKSKEGSGFAYRQGQRSANCITQPIDVETQHGVHSPRIPHPRRLAECSITVIGIVEVTYITADPDTPWSTSQRDNKGGQSMKNQPEHSSYENIVKTFRDLGLDDLELRRRLQDFSKSGTWPRQVKKSDDGVLVTRGNTASDEGDR